MMTVELKGLNDIDDMLSKIAPRQAQNIMRATIHGVAGTIRDDAKKAMPVDEGDMRKGTKIKRERTVRGQLLSTVRVAGAFYWRFVEYGQGPDGVEVAMFGKAVAKYRSRQNEIFLQQFGKKFEAALVRARKRQSIG